MELSSSSTTYMYNYPRRGPIVQLLPLLPSTNPNHPDCTLRRYNPETTSVNECLRCLGCSCLHHVQILTRFLVATSWDTRNPGAPHHLLHASAHFPFASVSQSSTGTGTLPWHRYRYHYRGTPFRFRHNDKCSHHAHVNIFIKLHITCSCHPHHDNNF